MTREYERRAATTPSPAVAASTPMQFTQPRGNAAVAESMAAGEQSPELANAEGTHTDRTTPPSEEEAVAALSALPDLGRRADEADLDEARELLNSVVEASDAGGPEAQQRLASALLDAGIGTSPALRDLVTEAVASGRGVELAAMVAIEAEQRGDIHPDVAAELQRMVTRGTVSARDGFGAARTERQAHEVTYGATYGAVAEAWAHPDLFDEEVLSEGVAEFEAEEYLALQEAESVAAGQYARSLQAIALMQEAGLPTAEFRYFGTQAAHLHETEGGRQETARALARSGAGETSWSDYLTAPEHRETVENSALEGVALAQAGGGSDMAANIAVGTQTALQDQLTPQMQGALRTLAVSMRSGSVLGTEHQAEGAAALNGLSMVDSDGRPTEEGRFLERMAQFAGAGTEAAERTQGDSFDADLTPAWDLHSAITGTEFEGSDAIGAAVGTFGSLATILEGSAGWEDYSQGLISGLEGFTEVSRDAWGNPSTAGARAGAIARGGNAIFGTLALVDALHDGDALAVASASTSLATTLGAARFVGKRLTGIVGLGIDAISLARAFGEVRANSEASRDILGPAAAQQLGVSEESGAAFARWASPGHLEKLELVAAHLGVPVEDYATEVLSMPQALRDAALQEIARVRESSTNLEDEIQLRLGAIETGRNAYRPDRDRHGNALAISGEIRSYYNPR